MKPASILVSTSLFVLVATTALGCSASADDDNGTDSSGAAATRDDVPKPVSGSYVRCGRAFGSGPATLEISPRNRRQFKFKVSDFHHDYHSKQDVQLEMSGVANIVENTSGPWGKFDKFVGPGPQACALDFHYTLSKNTDSYFAPLKPDLIRVTHTGAGCVDGDEDSGAFRGTYRLSSNPDTSTCEFD